MNKIEEALSKLFNKYRVIFWNDEKKELLEQFNELSPRWRGFAIRARTIDPKDYICITAIFQESAMNRISIIPKTSIL